jgi:hypothetical protein
MSYISNIFKTVDLSNIFYSFKSQEKPNSQVLDPLSCLIRLVLLNYKPTGTKLSFTNNKIIFQEPNMFQCAKRWSSGDSRQQIHNLYNPIFKIHQWYDIKKEELIYMLNFAKKGLVNLLKCYNNNDSNITSHSINYYIKTIDNILNNDLESDELESTTDIYSIKLKDLWNDREINIVYLLFLEIEDKINNNNDKFNNIESLIMSIEEILIGKDEIVSQIVNKISTSL